MNAETRAVSIVAAHFGDEACAGSHADLVADITREIHEAEQLAAKKLPNTVMSLSKLGRLVYPILLAQEAGELSESCASELLGKDIVSLREIKHNAISAVVGMLETLPSPMHLLLDGYQPKDKP